MMSKIASGGHFCMAVRKALGITTPSQRIIIDAPCDGVVTVYVQLVGDDRLLSLDLETLLQGTQPIFVERKDS